MKAASRIALDERRAQAMDMRAASFGKDDFVKHLAKLAPKPES